MNTMQNSLPRQGKARIKPSPIQSIKVISNDVLITFYYEFIYQITLNNSVHVLSFNGRILVLDSN
jgi:hypothetical protein